MILKELTSFLKLEKETIDWAFSDFNRSMSLLIFASVFSSTTSSVSIPILSLDMVSSIAIHLASS